MSEIIRGNVGEQAKHIISMMRDESGEIAVGNVLRRTCGLGGAACKDQCIVRSDQFEFDTTIREMWYTNPRECSDSNLEIALIQLGLHDKKVLMVGVTADNVGFGDELESYQPKTNTAGWLELPGFNAFFARTTELDALGRRLADCADLNFEFKDSEGNTIIGFEHGTRTNMTGEDSYKYDHNGKEVSFTQYVIGNAIDHYGADPSTFKIKLAAAIKGHNFTKHFESREQMESHVPGWLSDGFLTNVTNPSWSEGDPIVGSDVWEADTYGLIIHDIKKSMVEFGIPSENYNEDGIVDPGDSEGLHSSFQFRQQYGDTRDLYLTYVPKGNL